MKLLIQRVAINDTDWTPVTVPGVSHPNAVWLRNDSGVTKVRSIATDATTEDSFAMSAQYALFAGQSEAGNQSTANPLCYVQQTSGTGTLIVTAAQ